MPRNGSGTYSRTDGTYTGATVFAQESAAGLNIVPASLDTEAQDMADALTASIAKDGQTTPTANLPMGTYKHTGCGDPTADTEYTTRGYSKVRYGLGLDWHDGLVLTHAADTAHDITVSSGRIMDGTNVYIMSLTSAMTKRIDATWAAASTNGGLSDEDTLTDETWYGVWLLGKSTDTAGTDTDVIFATTSARSLGDTAATSAGFDTSRLIGFVLTYDSGGSNFDIRQFVNGSNGDVVWSVTPQTGITITTTATDVDTKYTPPFQQANVIIKARAGTGATIQTLFTQTDQADTAPSLTQFTVEASTDSGSSIAGTSTAILSIKVNGSREVQHRESTATADFSALYFGTLGYTMDYTVTDLV